MGARSAAYSRSAGTLAAHPTPTADPSPKTQHRRRLLLTGAATAATAAAAPLLVAEPAFAALPQIRPYRSTRIPGAYELHLMNRMGYGYSRSTWQQMRAAGGSTLWWEAQLRPGTVPENTKTKSLYSWFPKLAHTPAQRVASQKSGGPNLHHYARDIDAYITLRRIYSNRQVHEMMVEFWSNHFHVTANDGQSWMQRTRYDDTIRAHALGRFETLLQAVTLHPAMLLFLDNYRSVRGAPNENHGRELLELHTVGRTSGYTEEMVKDSAKILSGWTVDVNNTWEEYYDRAKHTTGAVKVLGFTDANSSSDGRAVTSAYLRYLAHHPATARTIARKLAVKFVSDSPSEELVNHLANVFRSSGTDIKSTLRALVQSTEFKRAAGKKVRTPHEDLIATTRVLEVNATKPSSNESFAMRTGYLHGGMLMYHWPRPDGAPDRNSAWTSSTRMLSSFRMHWLLAGRFYPKEAVVYRTPLSFLPERRIRFDAYIDHLCRLVHGRPSTPLILKAACQGTGQTPGTIVTRDHPLCSWMFPRAMAVLLDSPTHMTR